MEDNSARKCKGVEISNGETANLLIESVYFGNLAFSNSITVHRHFYGFLLDHKNDDDHTNDGGDHTNYGSLEFRILIYFSRQIFLNIFCVFQLCECFTTSFDFIQ